MGNGVVIPLHLAVHVLGLTVAFGLAGFAGVRRQQASAGWPGLLVGGLLLGVAHVATGALLAQDTAWPLYLRAAGYAALAVGAAGRLVGLGVVVAVAPPAAHVAAAIAGVAAAFAAARGVLGRGRAVLPLVAGLGLWAASDLALRSSATLAAGLSLAGSLSAGWWLLRRARRSLFARFLGAFLAVLLILVIGLASASGLVFSVDLQRDQLRRLEALTAARAEQLTQELPLELARSAVPFAGTSLSNELAAAAGTGASLDARARSIAAFPGIDAVVLVGPDGLPVGSWDALAFPPGRLGESDEAVVAGDELIRRALAGSTVSGVVALGDGDVLAIGATPVAPRDADNEPQLDRVTGVLVLTRYVTDERIVSEVERRTGAETTIVVAGEPVVSTLPPAAADDVAAVLGTGTTTGIVDLDGTREFLASTPLPGGDGTAVGTIVLSLDASALAGIEDDFARSVFGVALAGMVLATVLAGVSSSRTTRPIRQLTEAAERVAEGDLDVHVGIDRRDEVGRLAGAFDRMTAALRGREAALVEAAATEAALRGRLEIITASMGEALLAVDRAGVVTTANPAAATLLGLEGEEVVGRPVAQLLRGVDGTGGSLAAALGAPDDPGPAAVRGSLDVGRRLRPVSGTAAPLVAPDGDPVGRVYVLRDITGQVEVERMKTEFLSNISHELRTPLTPIKGYAEVLRVKDLGREHTVEFASNIIASAQRLERIIAMLVDFAALEAGRIEVQLAPTALGPVVDEVLGRWRERQPERAFRRRLARDLPPVQVDPDLLARVLEELIDNAVKFSDGDVRVTAERHDDGHVAVAVRDRGAGMEAELEELLRDFHQVDGSATRRYGGLGLGLSIVTRILQRFSAELRIESEVGVGTSVVLLLPVAES